MASRLTLCKVLRVQKWTMPNMSARTHSQLTQTRSMKNKYLSQRQSSNSYSSFAKDNISLNILNLKPTCTLCHQSQVTVQASKSNSLTRTRNSSSISSGSRLFHRKVDKDCHDFQRKKMKNLKRFFRTSTRYDKAIRIDGKVIAQDIKDEVKAEIAMLGSQGFRPPHLTVILVGNDPASIVYVMNKARAAEYTGITCEVLRLPENISERTLRKEIDYLNSHPDVDGILVQLPLPAQMNERTVCDSVQPDKDVDGFNVLNVGRVCVDQDAFMPATPAGVLEIICRLEIETWGKNAVVCGRSKNVGMPIAMQLHSGTYGHGGPGNATTTICHRHTPREELVRYTKAADIIVTATGVPGLITGDMVSDGVVVIDIGITRVEDERGRARLVGDVDFEGVSQKASMITPVPGGVGPVTVAMVIKNTLIAYKKGFGS